MIDNSCEHARELMAGAWTKELDSDSAASLQTHLDSCPACAAEMYSLTAMWERLGDLPAAEPSLALRARWEQTLDSFITPESATAFHQATPASRSWWHVWKSSPAWQVAFAALCLAIGFGAGSYLERARGERNEVASLREEVASTRQLVALSLLQQQSAADRLRGVDYSSRMSSLEPQIVSALIDTVNRDSSVNVRLAAVDALSKVAGDTRVRNSMQEALTQQDSPMVQAALIDYLVDARDKNALPVIRDLVARPGINPTVRERATYAVTQLAQ